MPQCIFCERETPHVIGGGRSLCVSCIVAIKKVELANRKEITEAVYPKDFRDALSRTAKFDPDKASADDVDHFKADVALLKKMIPV